MTAQLRLSIQNMASLIYNLITYIEEEIVTRKNNQIEGLLELLT